ncbi:MAG: radical SAM protein [Clostridia bacterium]|nr:radical SAM protein [Clostridia bacterium]
MSEAFNIQEYMTQGVENIVRSSLRAVLKNPRETAFMVRFAAASKSASKLRARQEKEGLHVPPFLIASITSSCNLHCAGCYSRANHATVDCPAERQLSGEEWLDIFREAAALGVSFILLAGGEPMLRRDVIEAAGEIGDILFPIFTNGTYMDARYFDLLDKSRNLLPVLSIEGGREKTDSRRGAGIYDRLIANMDELQRRDLIFGCSVTVTKENLTDVSSDAFIQSLADRGCKAVFFIEYVPVTEESRELAPDDGDREYLKAEIARLRRERPEIVFVSFPGDEKTSDGCIAAGRGFFHINSQGGAEPCPFSPYSDINVRDTSLKAAISSPLFRALRDEGTLKEDHKGGCVLFERRAQVEAFLQSER